MINVVGIGNAGCQIAEDLSQYPQYAIHKVDVGIPESGGSFPITKRSSPEEYEEKFSKRIFSDLKKIKGETLVIVAGGGAVSNCTLRVLEAFRGEKIQVLYIKPDTDFLSAGAQTLDKIVFGVLQQYARSGAIDKMYIVSNSHIEKVVGKIPLSSYYKQLNNIIASTFHMLNVYRNTAPVVSSLAEAPSLSRISTIGIGTMERVEDQMFFPLDFVTNKMYYFAINSARVDKDEDLLGKIKLRVKDEDPTVTTGFGVYSTSYEKDYIYIVADAKIIQGVNYDE